MVKKCLAVILLSFSPVFGEAAGLCGRILLKNEVGGYGEVASRVRTLRNYSALIEDFDGYAQRRYGREGADILRRLSAIGPEFKKLIVDPGIAIRMDEFERFVTEESLANKDPWAARMAFSRSLGNRKVYRTLALTIAEYENILKNGIDSSILRSQLPERIVLGKLESNLSNEIYYRVKPSSGRNSQDTLLSVSDSIDIAASATSMARRNDVVVSTRGGPYAYMESLSRQARKQNYAFELSIPELDILYYKDPVLPAPGSDGVKIAVGTFMGPRSFKAADRKVESFILLKVDPSEIRFSRVMFPAEFRVPLFYQGRQ